MTIWSKYKNFCFLTTTGKVFQSFYKKEPLEKFLRDSYRCLLVTNIILDFLQDFKILKKFYFYLYQ